MKKGKELFSSHRLKVKIRTLLGKFRQCYDLYSVARPQCKHEVGLLALRCSSFRSWLPTNFPDESITPKMHVLTYHISEKAKIMRTVGLEAENVSESIHPVMNKLQRTYCTVQNTQKRLELMAKGQWLKSDPRLKNFRIPEKRRKLKKSNEK